MCQASGIAMVSSFIYDSVSGFACIIPEDYETSFGLNVVLLLNPLKIGDRKVNQHNWGRDQSVSEELIMG